MRVKDLQHEEEIFLVAVAFDPLRCFTKDLRGEVILFHPEVGGVALITCEGAGAQGVTRHPFLVAGVFDGDVGIGDPLVVFLSANSFCAGEVEEIIS